MGDNMYADDNRTTFWSTDVYTTDDVIEEITHAMDAGTNMDHIDAYLAELVELGKITEDESDALSVWAEVEIGLW